MLLVDSGIKFISQQLAAELADWNHYKKAGYIFDSKTEFKLPNGDRISPDLSWVVLEQWDALSNEEKQSVPRLCPDFVIEILTPDKSLEQLRSKMREYVENGTRLGWLINPQKSSVEIYSVGEIRECAFQEVIAFAFEKVPTLLGGDVLPGFSVELQDIFNTQASYKFQNVTGKTYHNKEVA